MPKLRRFELHTLNEVIDDITMLRDRGYSRGGNWTLSQVCEHVAETLRVELDGTVKPLPWIVRATVGNLTFWLFTSRTVHGLSGIPTLKQLVPTGTPNQKDDPEKIEDCLRLLAEIRDRTEPIPPYPLATGVTLKKWQLMMVVHAQHHLEFLKPLAAERSAA